MIEVLDALDEAGVRHWIAGGWMPVRLELRAPGDRWVDVHPVAFDEVGHGRQADLDGGHFDYPPDVFSSGVIADRTVPCLSERQQRIFHSGYEPRPQDLHDLAQLDAFSGSAANQDLGI